MEYDYFSHWLPFPIGTAVQGKWHGLPFEGRVYETSQQWTTDYHVQLNPGYDKRLPKFNNSLNGARDLLCIHIFDIHTTVQRVAPVLPLTKGQRHTVIQNMRRNMGTVREVSALDNYSLKVCTHDNGTAVALIAYPGWLTHKEIECTSTREAYAVCHRAMRAYYRHDNIHYDGKRGW